jgi:hypothetical protein
VLVGPGSDGRWTLLLAEDRFYDGPSGAVTVVLGTR